MQLVSLTKKHLHTFISKSHKNNASHYVKEWNIKGSQNKFKLRYSFILILFCIYYVDCPDHNCMVAEFTRHMLIDCNSSCEFDTRPWRGVLDTILFFNVCQLLWKIFCGYSSFLQQQKWSLRYDEDIDKSDVKVTYHFFNYYEGSMSKELGTQPSRQ
jgi:hypothetical protein